MKTIAIFHPSSELYGADRILVNAINCFPESSKKIVYLKSQGPLVEFIEENTINTEVKIAKSMPIIYRAIFTPLGIVKLLFQYLVFFFYLIKEHRRNQFHLAYVNTLSVVFVLLILAVLCIKRFVHVHEIIDNPKLISKITAITASWFSNKVICVSKAVQDNLIQKSNRIQYKSIVLHNGINKIITGPIKSQRGITKFYLFGRISINKGHWHLVELSLVPRNLMGKMEVIMMGGTIPGKEKDLDLLRFALTKNKLNHIVKIRDFETKINRAMTDADVCLVPSQMRDPFPTTVLEAMSASRLVIATNNGGAKEVIQHKVNGFLVSPDNPQELANCITNVLLDTSLIRTLGQQAQLKFNSDFQLNHFKNRWANMLEELIPNYISIPKFGKSIPFLEKQTTIKTN